MFLFFLDSDQQETSQYLIHKSHCFYRQAEPYSIKLGNLASVVSAQAAAVKYVSTAAPCPRCCFSGDNLLSPIQNSNDEVGD